MDPISIGFGIASFASGIIGGASQDSAQNKAVERQYAYDKKVWKFENKQNMRDWRHAMEGVQIARDNANEERHWRNMTAKRDYTHGMKVRDYEYKMQMRAYNKSEETYKQQLNFNNMAAQVAMESEDRWLDEQFKQTAFQNQDLMVQLLQEEGQAALMQPGRSAGKAAQSVLAAAGRNQAILVESLVSAEKQYAVNNKKISTDKYGADLQAEANRMLKPRIGPALPKPIPLPKAKFQNPLKPKKTPQPIKGAKSNAGLISGITSGLSGLSGIDWK